MGSPPAAREPSPMHSPRDAVTQGRTWARRPCYGIAMPDQSPHQPNKNLTEISHLFLSSLRDRTTSGAPRPQRKPPAAPAPSNLSIDLTPEEFAQAFADEAGPDRGPAPVPMISAII